MPETLDPLRTDHCRLANVIEWKPEPDGGCCSARVAADTAHWANFSNTTEAGNNFFFWQTSKLAKTNVSGTVLYTCKCLFYRPFVEKMWCVKINAANRASETTHWVKLPSGNWRRYFGRTSFLLFSFGTSAFTLVVSCVKFKRRQLRHHFFKGGILKIKKHIISSKVTTGWLDEQ